MYQTVRIPPLPHPMGNYHITDHTQYSSREFLGPSPHVCGFQFSESRSSASIEWWDMNTQVKWIDNRTWENEVYFDEGVRGWVSKLRGDYSRNFDVNEYAGSAL